MSPTITEITTDTTQRINQGDVLSNVEFIESIYDSGEHIEINKILFPYVVVLSQDCDLEQDRRTASVSEDQSSTQDKYLLSVLVAPLYNYAHLREGSHLRELQRTATRINSDYSRYIKANRDARFHYLQFPDNIDIVESVVDFKHYFGVSVTNLVGHKKNHYICTIKELYREQVSVRFANYLSRIGLPNPEMNI